MLKVKVLTVAGLIVITAVVVGLAHGFPGGVYATWVSCGTQTVWVLTVTITHNNLAPPPGFAAQGFPFAAAPPNVANNGALSCTPSGTDWEPHTITITPHPGPLGPFMWTGWSVIYSCPPVPVAPANTLIVDPVTLGKWYTLRCPSTGITHGPAPTDPAGDAQILIKRHEVPTTTQWGLLALGVLLAGSLAFMIRRRFTVRPVGV